jgi:type III secretory pathway component EscS
LNSENTVKFFEMPKVRIRISALTYVVLGLMASELALSILCLSLPWGNTASGADIRFGIAGLLPWFGFLPVLLQAACLAVESSALRGLYLVMNFLIGVFIILVQYLTYIQYSNFKTGFYLVFVLGGIVLLAGIVCLVEKRSFTRLQEKGHTREFPVTFG